MTRAIVIGCVAAISLARPAAAREIGFVLTSPIKDKPAVTLDKVQAYILLRTDAALPLRLMKLPSPLDQTAYDGMRADALADARRTYPRKLANYEKSRALAEASKRQSGGSATRVPEKPIEPTEENFEFTPFGLLSGVSIGPMNRFFKQEGGASVYLQAVTPGKYRIYGPVAAGANGGWVGTCLCMGSVAFEARAGEITDLGTILVKAPEQAAGQHAEGIIPFNFEIRPATADMPVDPRLKDMIVRPADYRPVGKLPNYFGLTIDRLHQMPGVFRYDRDRIIDLTMPATGQ